MTETTGFFSIRMTKHLHERLSYWARGDQIPLNALILESLRSAVEARRSQGWAWSRPPGCAADRRALYHAALTTGDAEAARALGPDYELIAACIRGDLVWLRRLPRPGPGTSPEPDRGYEWSPLHYAANRGHLEVVRWLVEGGAAVNRREGNDLTPIVLAAAAGHWEVVRFLAAHGGEIGSAEDRGSVLSLARRRGPAEVLADLESLAALPLLRSPTGSARGW